VPLLPRPPAEPVLLVVRAPEEVQMLAGCIAAEGKQPCAWPVLAEALQAVSPADAGALVLEAQLLDDDVGRQALERWLAAQELWSDVPLLLLAEGATAGALAPALQAFVSAANVVLLQRPLAPATVASWLRSALRARRRQRDAQRLITELRRAVRFGETLVSVLGHDLRTPLAAAKLSAEVILRTSHDEHALRPAERVLSSSQRMQRLIEQLLDYTRVREGQMLPLHVREADLGAVGRAVCAEVENAAPDARLRFSEQGDPEGEWDPDRLAQLLTNLVMNAVKHGAPGGPVEVLLDGREPERVRLSVHNEGEIPAAVRPSMFEPFRGLSEAAQRDGSRYERAGEGLGLGLFIAREIARAHGGEIAVETSTGQGTTFTVTLPRRASTG
jgi:two-component system sensor histidine kinase/response regulator